jgi:hypothetical protein
LGRVRENRDEWQQNAKEKGAVKPPRKQRPRADSAQAQI